MKLKKAGVILITMAAVCGLAACSGKGKETGKEGGVQEQSVETENVGTPEDEEGDVTDGETEAPDTEEASEPGEDTAGSAMAAAGQEEFVPVAGLSENYADLENRSFAYNGQIFTLGESTLQDLIDGGFPFVKTS